MTTETRAAFATAARVPCSANHYETTRSLTDRLVRLRRCSIQRVRRLRLTQVDRLHCIGHSLRGVFPTGHGRREVSRRQQRDESFGVRIVERRICRLSLGGRQEAFGRREPPARFL